MRYIILITLEETRGIGVVSAIPRIIQSARRSTYSAQAPDFIQKDTIIVIDVRSSTVCGPTFLLGLARVVFVDHSIIVVTTFHCQSMISIAMSAFICGSMFWRIPSHGHFRLFSFLKNIISSSVPFALHADSNFLGVTNM